VDDQDIPTQMAATRLPSVGLCGAWPPSDFHFFGPLQEHLGGHIFQTVAEVQQTDSGCSHSPSPEFYAEDYVC
jgi:hypothetical protein